MTQRSARSLLQRQLQLMLADGMVEVELDPDHYNLAIDLAIDRLRQRSDGAQQEEVMFLTLQPEQTEYTLGDEVQEVRKIHRRNVGSGTSGGVNFDPFESAFSNLYFLQNGRTGGIATWHLFSEYQETLGKIFGSEIAFIWNVVDHKLTILRKFQHPETVLLTIFTQKSEDALMLDPYTKVWIREYSLAQAKLMLGEARSKYPGGFAGPNGNVVMNGEQLKQEAMTELERLEAEIANFVTGNYGMPFIIG